MGVLDRIVKAFTTRILHELRAGRSVTHPVQNRTLPRRVFLDVAGSLASGEFESIRYANGQERIVMRNGARYMIVRGSDVHP